MQRVGVDLCKCHALLHTAQIGLVIHPTQPACFPLPCNIQQRYLISFLDMDQLWQKLVRAEENPNFSANDMIDYDCHVLACI